MTEKAAVPIVTNAVYGLLNVNGMNLVNGSSMSMAGAGVVVRL